MPLVSIVVPTHNRPHLLAEALLSVQDQTFCDYEVIVISNGETPENRLTSECLATAFACRYVALPQGNVSAARNVGIERACGEWIAFLDDDDIWLPNKLQRQLADARRTCADMVSCDYVVFHPDGREIVQRPRCIEGWSLLKSAHYLYWWANPSAVMIKTKVLASTGGFDPRQRLGEDAELWRRVLWHHSVYQIDEVLMRYRQGHASMMTQERRRFWYDLRYFAKLHLDTPRHLRSEIPSFMAFVPPRIIGILASDRLLALLHRIGPRRRILEMRGRLRIRTRARAVAAALGWRW